MVIEKDGKLKRFNKRFGITNHNDNPLDIINELIYIIGIKGSET